MNQKKIIVILGVVVVVLLGTTIYYTTINKATRPATIAPKVADQQFNVYKNEKYGFEFQYPTTWSFDESASRFNPNVPKNCGPNIDETKKEPTCMDGIFFTIEPNEENLPIIDLFEKNGWKNGVDYRNLRERKIGTTTAYIVTMTSAYDNTDAEQLWVTLKDGSFFILNESYLVDDEKNVFNQMVNTFKFTE